jgi:hypothetical protein
MAVGREHAKHDWDCLSRYLVEDLVMQEVKWCMFTVF